LGRGATAQEIASVTGLHRWTIYRHLKAMRSARVVYIDRYTQDELGRASLSVWCLGDADDVPKPTPASGAKRGKLFRERRKKNKDNAE
jgi:hypothetical protein